MKQEPTGMLLRILSRYIVLPVLACLGLCVASAQAEPPDISECEGVCDASLTDFYWTYGDSVMEVQITGKSIFILYHQPRQGLIDEGVQSGSMMLVGTIGPDNDIAGKSRLYRKDCGTAEFPVHGGVDRENGIIQLAGKMPKRTAVTCQVERFLDATIKLSRTESTVPGSAFALQAEQITASQKADENPLPAASAPTPTPTAPVPARPSGSLGGCQTPSGAVVITDIVSCQSVGGQLIPAESAPASPPQAQSQPSASAPGIGPRTMLSVYQRLVNQCHGVNVPAVYSCLLFN